MRPPNIPSFSLSRRAKIILSVVGILILVLIVRPSGLFGAVAMKKV